MEKFGKAISHFRSSPYDTNAIFVQRWSPHALSGEIISDDDLMTLFEAARWAPSSFNEQPWRFVWARRETKHWDAFFDLLLPSSKEWALQASHLVIIVVKKNFSYNGKENMHAEFDTGAAWAHIALQAADMDIVAHGIAAFDPTAAAQLLTTPETFTPIAMIALGTHGTTDDHLTESLRKRQRPSDRKPLAHIVAEGHLPPE